MKGLCYFNKLNEPRTVLIKIINATLLKKTERRDNLLSDFIGFFVNYNEEPNFYTLIEDSYVFDFKKLSNLVFLKIDYPIETFSLKGTIYKVEEDVKYSYTIGLGVSYDNSALYLSRFLPIDEIISQLIYLINEPVFFIQIAEIGYSNTGIYMNLEGDTIGSIFYCEEDPEFADKEQIHFLASNFSTFMAMINLYEFRYASIISHKPTAKLVGTCKE